MPRLMVEIRSDGKPGRSMRAMVEALERAGAEPVPGFQPVPMESSDAAGPTFILTVDVADAEVTKKIEALPCVVQVYGDTPIAPFGS